MSTPTTRPVPSGLVASGTAELAAAALTGWVYTLCVTRPDLAKKLGIASADRIRQWHLDLVMMGSATVALGTAVPDAPRLVRWSLGIGAWTNATAFLPMALKPDVHKSPVFQAATAASFVATTTGFCGMALTALRRRRRAAS